MTREGTKPTPYERVRVTTIYPPAMANAPCARFTNPINPIVTDRPTEVMKRNIA
jgi:hypothetical protein